MKPEKETPEQKAKRLYDEAELRYSRIIRDRCLVAVGRLKKKRGGMDNYILKREAMLIHRANELDKQQAALSSKKLERDNLELEIRNVIEAANDEVHGEYDDNHVWIPFFEVPLREHTHLPPTSTEPTPSPTPPADIPLESTKPTSTLADYFMEVTEPTFTIPTDCHPQVKANCEEMLKGGISERMMLEILDNWWFWEDSSLIYGDCIYYLYGIEIPERLLEMQERVALKMKLVQHTNTGAK
jgi:hypothetical protein